MIKAVLFDFGGVLTEGGKSGAIQTTVAQLCNRKFEDIQISDLHDPFVRGDMTEEQYFAEINRRYPCASPLAKANFNTSSDIYEKSEPVYALATRLRAHGITTGMLSNIYPISAEKLRAEGFYDDFEPLILSCYEHVAKPDMAIFELALRKLGLPGNQVLFIDDQQRFQEIAESIGMQFILAESPQQIVHDTEALLLKENKLRLQ